MASARILLLSLIPVIALGSAAAPGVAVTWSPSADWSSTANPSGPWTCGYLPLLGGAFAIYGVAGQGDGGTLRSWSSDGGGGNGCVIKNTSSQPYAISGMRWKPLQVSIHPGVVNQSALGTFRWTAAAASIVQIDFSFSGIDTAGTTTDVHVLKNGMSLFDGTVSGFAGSGDAAAFGSSPNVGDLLPIAVAPGDTIDFAVGAGSNGYVCDTTGLDATITEVSGGLVTGTVRAASLPGQPMLPAATVQTGDSLHSIMTDEQGAYSLLLPAGTYTLHVSRAGFVPAEEQVAVSDGQSVVKDFCMTLAPAIPIARLGDVKILSDGVHFTLTQPAVATAASTTFADGIYYLEDPDRICGIKVIPPAGADPVSIGDRITLSGVVGTDGNGERMISAVAIDSRVGGSALPALGTTSKNVPLLPGLLVRTWGRVAFRADDSSYVYVDDGRMLHDGSGKAGVRVMTDAAVLVPSVGDYVAVTGIGCRISDGALTLPAIRATADIDVLAPGGTSDPTPTADEMATAQAWMAGHLAAQAPEFPFSFTYNGQSSAELLQAWPVQSSVTQLGDDRQQMTLTWTDPATGLRVRCVAVEYADYPTVEWTLTLTNISESSTPILSNIAAIDTGFTRTNKGEFVLHYIDGDNCSALSYQPHSEPLLPGTMRYLAPYGGRPTEGPSPYYNIEWPGEGAIVVLGWAGRWSATFTRNDTTGLRMWGGQELTHLVLRPGESVRSPLAVVQFYKGDRVRAQNIWRRWMLAHNLPRPGGNLPNPMIYMSTGAWCPGMLCTEESEKEFIDGYVANGVKPDLWWTDAGWYQTPSDWTFVGTWEVDMGRYPDGLRGVTDYAHALGMKYILWFEPERVSADSWLALNHPEWILGGSNGGLLNLGDPSARSWLIDHVDGLMVAEGIDFYRNDFNMDPLGYWRGNDPADRQGITEIGHVTGIYAFWDEIRRRHPNALLDTCASGGRRIDLETLRRAVPLLRSDYQFDPIAQQDMTYGLAAWVPYYGTGVSNDAYAIRSSCCPTIGIGVDVRSATAGDYELMRRMEAEWRQVVEYMSGDYYPLTAYSSSSDVWMAWQFDAPDDSEGAVWAYRRDAAASVSICLKLRALEPEELYTVTDLDTGQLQELTGRELMRGLTFTAPSAPTAKILTYKKKMR